MPGIDSPTGDSAGVPWAGREVKPSPFAGDRGESDPALLAALQRVAAGGALDAGAHVAVVEALRAARMFVPIMASVGAEPDEGAREHGHDGGAEMAMVTVAAEDGRATVPAFTGVASLAGWNRQARPIPVGTRRLALAAVDEGSQLVIVDPGSEHRFLLRRPAVWALAQDVPWLPAWANPRVADAVRALARDTGSGIAGIEAAPGSARPDVGGAELLLILTLAEGTPPEAVPGLLAPLQQGLSTNTVIAEDVDSLAITVRAS